MRSCSNAPMIHSLPRFPSLEVLRVVLSLNELTVLCTLLYLIVQTTPVAEDAASMPHDLPLPRVRSLGSDEGSLSLNELTVLCKIFTMEITLSTFNAVADNGVGHERLTTGCIIDSTDCKRPSVLGISGSLLLVMENQMESQYQNEVNDICAERIAQVQILSTLAECFTHYSDNYIQAQNLREQIQHILFHKPMIYQGHKGIDRSPNSYTSIVSVSDEDNDLNKLRGIRTCKRFGTLANHLEQDDSNVTPDSIKIYVIMMSGVVKAYTSVSRPQLKSYQVKDKVVPNNSQVKLNYKEVEEHLRISSISRKTKSIYTIILVIVDLACTMHIERAISSCLCNFVEKISVVYYVEGPNHNLFLVGQFCDADLEVAFRKSTYFVRDLQGNDLLTGLPKLKYVKDQLCSSYEMSKAKRSYLSLKLFQVPKEGLNLLHMDLAQVLEQVTHAYFKKKALYQTSYSLKTDRTTLSKDRTTLLLRLLERCFQLLRFPLSFWAEAVATACYMLFSE
ncbi:hypothetical protein Tco_0158632 [Tanacetum coccineum]